MRVVVVATLVLLTSCTDPVPGHPEGQTPTPIASHLPPRPGTPGSPVPLPPIATVPDENRLPGDPGWQLTVHQNGLEAWADHVSAAPGEDVDVHASAPTALPITWSLYRLGYYAGAGGRALASGGPLTIGPAPPAVADPTTGAVRAPWPVSFTIPVPDDAPSGLYLVVLRAANAEAEVPLMVRERFDRHAPVLVLMPFANYQAYNDWGGTSLYTNRRSDVPLPHAVAVSFDRPYAANQGSSQVFFTSRDFITFAESQGWDIGYASDVDLDADPTLLDGRRLVVEEGHAEYWTRNMRDRFEAARDGGVNLAFLGANNGFWQARFDDDTRRLLDCYKDLAEDDPILATDATLKTGLWRDLGRPEGTLFGVQFGSWQLDMTPLRVQGAGALPWAGSGAADGDLIPGLVGYESDYEYTGAGAPTHAIVGTSFEPDHDGNTGVASAALVTAPSGARVFAAGTVQWSQLLARAGKWDARVQAAMAHLMAQLGGVGDGTVAPLTLPPGPAPPDRVAGTSVTTVTSALVEPRAVAARPGGGAYVVDRDQIVLVDAAGAVHPLAGGAAGDLDGPAASARFRRPRAITVDAAGNLWIADTGNSKVKRLGGGQVVTVAGAFPGFADGIGTQALFQPPFSIGVLPSGLVLVSDPWNGRIRAIDPVTSAVTTWAGTGARDLSNGPALQAALYFPTQLAVRSDGSVAFLEDESGAIRVVGTDAARTITMLAGDVGRDTWNDGALADAGLFHITALAARGTDLALLDAAPSSVRLLRGGAVRTLAGGATGLPVDGDGARAGFTLPFAAAFQPDGSLLVVDAGNHALRRIAGF